MELSLVIPAYNEAGRIAATLDAYLPAFPDVEFIIVPNGCHDATVQIVEGYAQRYRNVRVHVIPAAVGKAEAVRAGFRLATGDWVGFVDADGSTSPAELRNLLAARGTADGVIASRWARGAVVENRTFIRQLASLLFAMAVKLLFWLPYRDTQCGAKLFRRTLIQRVLPYTTVRNPAFDVELLLLCRSTGATVPEHPTHWVDRSDSVIIGTPWKLLRSSCVMLWTLFLLRLRFLPFLAPRV